MLSGTGETIRVALGPRSYDIQVGVDLLHQAATLLGSASQVGHVAVISDANVSQTHGATVVESFSAAGVRVEAIQVPAGEHSKSIDEANRLWNELLARGIDRRSAIVAVGGGVMGDLAGFAAATFGRGIPLFQIPTTLLAQVDSSVGGKVGINLPGAKNMVGAFWQPVGVLIDPRVLETLPEREYRSGLAEVVKYGVILDAEFFACLEQQTSALNERDEEVLVHVIARSCRLKADVVEQDEREETGLRAVLNYGHTFAHAFETLTGYSELLHGEAVSMGMVCASHLAQRLGRIDAEVTRRQAALLGTLQLPLFPPELSIDDVLDVMSRDKKTVDGRLRFVLPTKLGHVELVEDVPPEEVAAAISAARADAGS